MPQVSDAVFARVPAALERWLGSTIAVLVPGTGSVVVLDGVGALTWAGLAHPASVDDLVEAIISVSVPDGGPDEARLRVVDAIDQLVGAGLVVEIAPEHTTSRPHAPHAVPGGHAEAVASAGAEPETAPLAPSPAPPPSRPPRPSTSLPGPRASSRPPGRSAEPHDRVEALLAHLAVHHLPGAPAAPPGLLDDVPASTARRLVDRAVAERVSGSVVAAVQAGLVDLGDEATTDLFGRHRDELARSLLREELLWELAGAFAAAEVTYRVIKGPAVAHLDEPDPSWRTFGDLDLLVRVSELDRAVALLRRDGATRPWAERRTGYDARFAKSVTLTTTAGIEVDVHRSLCDGAHGFRVPLDRLFASAEPFRLADREVPALVVAHRLLHAGHHAVLGSPRPRLMSLRDLAGYLTRPDLDVDVVAAEVAVWRGEAVLAEAVQVTGTVFGWLPEPWAAWLDTIEVTPAESRIVARQQVEGSSFGPAKLDAIRELPWRDRPAYALGVAVPSREHLRSRDLHRLDLVRGIPARWARRTRRLSRRGPSA